MPSLNVFDQDAFSTMSLTAVVNEMDFVPGTLSASGMFEEFGVATTTVFIEKKGETLKLIATSPRGAPPEQRVRDKRTVRSLVVPHLAKEAVVYADQVQDVRAFGSESDSETAMTVLNQELDTVLTELDMTLENLRLGAVKGIILDADGSTLFNLFTEFGVTQETEVDYELDVATTDVHAKNTGIIRTMHRNIKLGNLRFRVRAICGDDFYDKLTTHAKVEAAYDRWQDGQFLRENRTWKSSNIAGLPL